MLLSTLIFSVVISACITTIIQTLEKWNFSEWFKVRTGINVCYFCCSFWFSFGIALAYLLLDGHGNFTLLLTPLIVPALTSFFHNSPLKGL